jgi:hypothetical protein
MELPLHTQQNQSRALIQNNIEITDRSSRQDLTKNADGSVDLYLGPEAPVGFEKNWIPTLAGKAWFPYFGPAVAMESNPELGITLHCYRQSFYCI